MMTAKSNNMRVPVEEARIHDFIEGIYGQNKRANSAAAKKALKAVLFGVAAEAYAQSRRRR